MNLKHLDQVSCVLQDKSHMPKIISKLQTESFYVYMHDKWENGGMKILSVKHLYNLDIF